MAKIDSGLGWKVDEEFYIDEADTLIDEDDYGRKKYDGAAIIAVVFEGENTQGRPVMISTAENNCLNTQAMTAYSSTVGGVTWYGTRQNTLLRENEIIVGAKVTVAEGINPYYFPDDADTRAAIISAIITQAGVEYTPKVTTTDYVKGYVEGVVKENNELMLDAVNDILTDDTAYPSSAMVEIPDCKVPANAAVSVEFEPIQEGTGDPSPENIRPISGRNNISITRTGSTPTTYVLSLNGTRYGGRVDITDTGEAVLTVDRKCITLNLSDAPTVDVLGDYSRYLYSSAFAHLSDIDVTNLNASLCDIAPYIANWYGQYTHFYIFDNAGLVITLPTNAGISSFQVCYPIATPFQIPLTNTPIKLEKGTNNLYSDAGDISAKTNGITSAIGALTEQVNDITLYPAPPTTDGTYTLQVTVSSGVPTYTWAAVNRSAPVVNEPDEELKKSEDSVDISEEKEIDISEKDVSKPTEKKEDIPDESEKELEEDIPAEEEKSELTDEPVESAEKTGEDITEENGDAEVEKILESE